LCYPYPEGKFLFSNDVILVCVRSSSSCNSTRRKRTTTKTTSFCCKGVAVKASLNKQSTRNFRRFLFPNCKSVSHDDDLLHRIEKTKGFLLPRLHCKKYPECTST
jgi:hypothetical protein